MELVAKTRVQGDCTVVSVSGEIDLYTVPRLHAALDAALAGGPARLVVDLAAVAFCDSTGMNTLLAAHRKAREQGGRLELARPQPTVRKVLQVTGLDSVFSVMDDPAAVAGQ